MLDKLKQDLPSARLMVLKGALFAVIVLLCAAGILVECGSWRVALLLGLALWAACRFYYFLFYVIERYIDPGFRFAGLSSALLYLWNRRRQKK